MHWIDTIIVGAFASERNARAAQAPCTFAHKSLDSLCKDVCASAGVAHEVFSDALATMSNYGKTNASRRSWRK